jgi:hypothetical protein
MEDSIVADETKSLIDMKSLITGLLGGAIGFVLTAVFTIIGSTMTDGTVIQWMGGLTKHNLAFEAARVGTAGPIIHLGDKENLFTEKTTAQNSEDFAFCTLSEIQINKPGGLCRLERQTSKAWAVIPTDAACQLTCFNPVVAR